MLTIRQANPLLDFQLVLEGAQAFSTHMNRPDILPANGSQAQVDSVYDMLRLPGFNCLLAEDGGKLQGGIGYFISPYIHDKTKLHGEEFFWWAMPGASPRAGMKLLNEMFEHWKIVGVKVFSLTRLWDSPEGVDVVYRKKGSIPMQVTYAGTL